jgi:hypothetical protein
MDMTTQLTFAEEFRYRDDASGITIPVTVVCGGRTLRVYAKVDTGAEVCLFKSEHGEELGLAIEQGVPKVLNTLGGPLEAFGHEVTIQTGELAFQSLVYFAKYPGLPHNILGRQGWLRSLRLAVIDYDNLLYLSAYDA